MVARARRLGLDVLGWPRLVRLNPNVPWKTRGNAALGVRLGRGTGRPWKVGEVDGSPVYAYPRGREVEGTEREAVEAALWETVRTTSRTGEPGTDPAMVVSGRRPDPALYRSAVRGVVPVDAARAAVTAVGGRVHTAQSWRGIVGAAAAIAWPARRVTWELIAYRSPDREATRRRVDGPSVVRAARRFPELFRCYDRRTRRLLVAPHTPCPILFGLRARRPARLERAFRSIAAEPADRWLIFATNQGSGDHLRDRRAGALQPYDAARVTGRVATVPESGRGGHVRFELLGTDGVRLPCVVFEPTKTLPGIARNLGVGDRVRLWGGRGADTVLRVEGIEVRALAARLGPARAPRCPRCGVRARSLGTHRGYRCPRCHRRWPSEAAARPRLATGIGPGTYHPTPSALRHLHPLSPKE